MRNARSAALLLTLFLWPGAGVEGAHGDVVRDVSDLELRQLQQLRTMSQTLARQRGRRARADMTPTEAPWLSSFAELLGRELLLLEPFVVAETVGVPPGQLPEGDVLRLATAGPGGRRDSLELPVGEYATLAVRLENVGDEDVVDPRLTVNERDWSSVEGLVADATRGLDDQASVAEALWAFVVENRRHEQPAHEGVECHDPVRLFNAYGYGLCDDAANVLANLARVAGLEARVWALGGHVVSELRYDSSWHMFDADHEVFYRKPSGEVASLDDLLADPSILGRPERVLGRTPYPLDSERFLRQVSSAEDNSHDAYVIPDSWHAMGFTLRSGERVTLHRGNWGHRFAAGRLRAPRDYANGVWEDRWPTLSADSVARRRYELPWPIVGGLLRVSGVRASAVRDWRLTVDAPDGTRRGTLVPVWRGGALEFDLDLALQLGSGDPDYAIELSLSGPNDAVSDVTVDTQLVFQHAPLALPRLVAGENTVRLVSRRGSRIDATLVYAER